MKMTNSKANATLERTSVETLCGWSPFKPLDQECRNVFNEAMKGLVGVAYTPIEVSTQLVNGVNYRFRCEARIITPNAPKYIALVEIHQPFNGLPIITNITQYPICGGWSAFHPLNNDEKNIFNEAIKGLVGVNYTPIEVSTQVVEGMNYRFLCNAELPSPTIGCYRVIMEICEDLTGAPRICEIKRI